MLFLRYAKLLFSGFFLNFYMDKVNLLATEVAISLVEMDR